MYNIVRSQGLLNALANAQPVPLKIVPSKIITTATPSIPVTAPIVTLSNVIERDTKSNVLPIALIVGSIVFVAGTLAYFKFKRDVEMDEKKLKDDIFL
ncbi:MAG: hypothetical protein V4556_12260 [Bacteroidota bacterium]